MRYPLFRGVRSKPRTARSAREAPPEGPRTMSDPQWLRGVGTLERLGLLYDFRVPYFHLKEGAEVARRFSGSDSSSSITPDCRAIAAPKGWRSGATG